MTLRGHDWEGFALEILRYGLWKADLEQIGDAVQQLRLDLGGRCVMGHAPALYRHWERCVEENQQLRQQLHDRDHTIEHLVQANHALHDELAAARARIAALENQLDELGDDPGAQIRLVVDAARRFVQALDATEAGIRPDPEGVIDGPHGQALRAAVAGLDAAREVER